MLCLSSASQSKPLAGNARKRVSAPSTAAASLPLNHKRQRRSDTQQTSLLRYAKKCLHKDNDNDNKDDNGASLPTKRQKGKSTLTAENVHAKTARLNPKSYYVAPEDEADESDLPVLRPRLPKEYIDKISETEVCLKITEVVQFKNDMWVFGVTEKGESISVQVEFHPWFYVELPARQMNKVGFSGFRNSLNTQHSISNEVGVVSVREASGHELIGFHIDLKTRKRRVITVARVECSSPRAFRHYVKVCKQLNYKMYNEETPMRVLFFVAIDSCMNGWIRLTRPNQMKSAVTVNNNNNNNNHNYNTTRKDGETYNNKDNPKYNIWKKRQDEVRRKEQQKRLEERQVTCQLEFYCRIKDTTSQPQMDLVIGKLLRVVFDIETLSALSSKHKPDPNHPGDVVNMISSIFQWADEERPASTVLMCLGKCTPLPANYAGQPVLTLCYATEQALLLAWHRMVFITCNVDVILGYNSVNYDLWYLYERGKILHLPELAQLSRFRNHIVEKRIKISSSAQRGDEEVVVLDTAGISHFDVYRVLKKGPKLPSYSLGFVVKELLLKKETPEQQKRLGKLDLDYELMRPYFLSGSGYDPTDFDPKLQKPNELPNEVGPNRRQEVAIYCLRDSEVTMKLALKHQLFENYMQMAKLCHTSNSQLMIDGEAVKVWNYACFQIEVDHWFLCKADLQKQSKENPVPYAGGKVLDAKVGFYMVPVTTFDFQSLYPSIMDALNTDYSTIVFDPEMVKLIRECGYEIEECKVGAARNPHFVQNVPALLPSMLKKLIAARKQAQDLMRATEDEFKRNVLNATQAALKITCNSVYGFTGAGASSEESISTRKRKSSKTKLQEEVLADEKRFAPASDENDDNDEDDEDNNKGVHYGKWASSRKRQKTQQQEKDGKEGDGGGGFLTCVGIAAAVTKRGQEMIMQTKQALEEKGAEVLYGDTDSVMVILKEARDLHLPSKILNAEQYDKLLKLMLYADSLSEDLSKMFRASVRLNFEKMATRYLSLGKKKYSMMVWELEKDKKTKAIKAVCQDLKNRGLESVRRDWCPLSRRLGQELVDMVMNDASFEELTGTFQNYIERMERNEFPLDDYRLTRALKAKYSHDKHCHLQVANKIRERDPAQALGPGERVQYIITDVERPLHLKSEDIEYSKKHNLIADKHHYFTKQLLVPSARIAKALEPNAKAKWEKLGANLKRISAKNHAITSYFSQDNDQGTETSRKRQKQ